MDTLATPNASLQKKAGGRADPISFWVTFNTTVCTFNHKINKYDASAKLTII